MILCIPVSGERPRTRWVSLDALVRSNPIRAPLPGEVLKIT